MSTFQQIEHHQRICHHFFTFNLTCCKFVALKKNTLTHSFQNHYSKQTKHPPQAFLFIGRSECPTKGRNLEQSTYKRQSLNFPLLLDITFSPQFHRKIEPPYPPFYHRPHIGKKVSIIAFRQNLQNIWFAACIVSHTLMTYLKKLVETKSSNTKHCQAGLSSRIKYHVAPFLPKIFPPFMLLCCPHQVQTVPCPSSL